MRIKIMAESADHNMNIAPEWSYKVNADEVVSSPLHLDISPNEEEIKDLLRRLGLEEIKSLRARLTLKREDKRVVQVTGTLNAVIVQNCIVTTQPVEEHVEDHFEAWYADPAQAVSFARARHERDKERAAQERPMLEEHEDPEPIIDGQIDVGELVTQYLSLSINPYPQSAEAIKRAEEDAEGQPTKENPFAALKSLKEKK